MKKNKMMRIASVLLIVTILSTCAISGTFAKYVATAEAEDSARVAKWGITIETSGSMFNSEYASTDEGYIAGFGQGALSVKAEDGAKVVAPGTTSNVDGNHALVATVTGTPEVATRFSLSLGDLSDIVLPNGTYTDYTGLSGEDTFDLAIDTRDLAPSMNNNYWKGYAPVKWDVTVKRVTETGYGNTANLVEIARGVASSMGLSDFATAFVTAEGVSITDAKTIASEVERLGLKDTLIAKMEEQYRSLDIGNLAIDITADGDVTLSLDFAPNQNLNYEFTIDWTWAFEQQAPAFVTNEDARDAYTALFDMCDTYLGNVAAEIVDEPNDAVTELGFHFIASAVQID